MIVTCLFYFYFWAANIVILYKTHGILVFFAQKIILAKIMPMGIILLG